MSETVTLRLWYIEETEKARLYSKTAPGRDPDTIWIPKSIIEHTRKNGSEHHVKLPDWFIQKQGL